MKFPHLYRCGHIEALAHPDELRALLSDFRIFIDAATLKRRDYGAGFFREHDFRIFIDAATLKLALCCVSVARQANFRIFIDAATLKLVAAILADSIFIAFPHLYRCGHIEAYAYLIARQVFF